MNVESEAFHEPARRTSAETVAGYLSAVALIASGMSKSRRQLTMGAVLICAVCLFLGFTVAVVTSHPLW